MRQDAVAIGAVYLAKVSGTLTRVRIDSEAELPSWREFARRRWNATNLTTSRKIVVTAARLRVLVAAPKEN